MLVFCEIKLLSELQWDSQRRVAAVPSSGMSRNCRLRVLDTEKQTNKIRAQQNIQLFQDITQL